MERGNIVAGIDGLHEDWFVIVPDKVAKFVGGGFFTGTKVF